MAFLLVAAVLAFADYRKCKRRTRRERERLLLANLAGGQSLIPASVVPDRAVGLEVEVSLSGIIDLRNSLIFSRRCRRRRAGRRRMPVVILKVGRTSKEVYGDVDMRFSLEQGQLEEMQIIVLMRRPNRPDKLFATGRIPLATVLSDGSDSQTLPLITLQGFLPNLLQISLQLSPPGCGLYAVGAVDSSKIGVSAPVVDITKEPADVTGSAPPFYVVFSGNERPSIAVPDNMASLQNGL